MSEKHEVYPIFFTAPTRNERRLLFPTTSELRFLDKPNAPLLTTARTVVLLRSAALPPNAPSRFTSYMRSKKDISKPNNIVSKKNNTVLFLIIPVSEKCYNFAAQFV